VKIARKKKRNSRQRSKGGKLKGHGAYDFKPLVAKGLRAGGAMAGKAIAEGLGVPEVAGLASKAGEGLGGFISKLFGCGKYKVKQNTIQSGVARATFGNKGMGVRVCKREFVANVSGSVGFASREFRLNPADPVTFPWLSRISSSFLKYQMNGCVLQYIPTSAQVAGADNPSLGTVIMCTQLDPEAPRWTTKPSMEATTYCTSSAPYMKRQSQDRRAFLWSLWYGHRHRVTTMASAQLLIHPSTPMADRSSTGGMITPMAI